MCDIFMLYVSNLIMLAENGNYDQWHHSKATADIQKTFYKKLRLGRSYDSSNWLLEIIMSLRNVSVECYPHKDQLELEIAKLMALEQGELQKAIRFGSDETDQKEKQ